MQRSHAIKVLARSRKREPCPVERPLILAAGLLTLALTALGSPDGPGASEIPYALTHVSSRVIVLDCQSVNVIAIAARSGIVVIDSNRSTRIMQRLRKVIEEEFGRKDFIYLVNTHGDPDHSSGNQAFPSVPLIAHRDYASFVLHARASTLRNRWTQGSHLKDAQTRYKMLDPASREAEELRARISALESTNAEMNEGRPPKIPAVTFTDSLRLDLGDLTLELRFCGQAHTNHDIVVYVPEEKLLLSGDLICSPQSPCFRVNAMADVPRLVRELDGLLQRESGLETVVPGHGAILTRADMSNFCRAVSEQYGKVRIDHSAARILGQAIEKEGIQAALKLCPPPARGGQATANWSEEEFGTLGVRLIRKGMIAEAVSVLRLAIVALPESAYLYGCLGDACLENDDPKAAASAYANSLALEPGNRRPAEMLEILRGRE